MITAQMNRNGATRPPNPTIVIREEVSNHPLTPSVLFSSQFQDSSAEDPEEVIDDLTSDNETVTSGEISEDDDTETILNSVRPEAYVSIPPSTLPEHATLVGVTSGNKNTDLHQGTETQTPAPQLLHRHLQREPQYTPLDKSPLPWGLPRRSSSGNSLKSPLHLYEDLNSIGSGSFGRVRKVRRKSDGVICACKELKLDHLTGRHREQIIAEANILKSLNHENIVEYYDHYIDEERKVIYILMEYCSNGDLNSLITESRRRNEPLRESVIWIFMVQLLQALCCCHSPETRKGTDSKGHPVIHRDIKPHNVFVGSEYKIKLADFGLSKVMKGARTHVNSMAGTLPYMSPEQISNKPYGSKADIWSLGCLIYELCALRPPFSARTEEELTHQIQNGRYPALPAVVGYSKELIATVDDMLEVNPNKRPSALELLDRDIIKNVMRHRSLSQRIKKFEEKKAKEERELNQREHICLHRESEIKKRQERLMADEDQIQEMIQKRDIEFEEREQEMYRSFKNWESDIMAEQRKRDQEASKREITYKEQAAEQERKMVAEWNAKEARLNAQITKLRQLIDEREKEITTLKNQLANNSSTVAQAATPMVILTTPNKVDTPSTNPFLRLLENSPLRDFKRFERLSESGSWRKSPTLLSPPEFGERSRYFHPSHSPGSPDSPASMGFSQNQPLGHLGGTSSPQVHETTLVTLRKEVRLSPRQHSEFSSFANSLIGTDVDEDESLDNGSLSDGSDRTSIADLPVPDPDRSSTPKNIRAFGSVIVPRIHGNAIERFPHFMTFPPQPPEPDSQPSP